MYNLTDTFVLIFLIFAVFLSVTHVTLNKLFAVFIIYYIVIFVTIDVKTYLLTVHSLCETTVSLAIYNNQIHRKITQNALKLIARLK